MAVCLCVHAVHVCDVRVCALLNVDSLQCGLWNLWFEILIKTASANIFTNCFSIAQCFLFSLSQIDKSARPQTNIEHTSEQHLSIFFPSSIDWVIASHRLRQNKNTKQGRKKKKTWKTNTAPKIRSTTQPASHSVSQSRFVGLAVHTACDRIAAIVQFECCAFRAINF